MLILTSEIHSTNKYFVKDVISLEEIKVRISPYDKCSLILWSDARVKKRISLLNKKAISVYYSFSYINNNIVIKFYMVWNKLS